MKIKLSNIKISLVLGMFWMLTGCSINANKVYQTDKGAISGFDPVAYFVQNKAVPGEQRFSLVVESVDNKSSTKWFFSSLKNQQLFAQQPKKYTPQYGGYCAYAMSYGLVVSSDPYAFSIIDNKLYLNYSLSVRDKWLKDPERFVQEADMHWVNKI